MMDNDEYEPSDDDPPSIRAARNPNPQILISVLNECTRRTTALGPNPARSKLFQVTRNLSANTYVSGAIHNIYDSPLVSAINACLPLNVATLLAAGADPNGVLLADLDEYSVRFIRGRNPDYNTYSYVMCPCRAKVMPTVGADIPQTSPLTPFEIASRRKVFSRFWSEHDLPTQRFRSGPARTALEVAATVGNVQLFDQVRAAGPDDSWWLLNPTPENLPDTLTHSALSTSSPIHEAIIAGKTNMLNHLLSLGYSPNMRPIAAPTRCLSPHLTAIASCDPPNLEAYDILAQFPKTDLSIRTPIFSIHVLHFATARLDLPLLQRLISNPNTALEAAGKTALGHTLLHVSTLPLTDQHINIFSEKIFRSIHEVRTLDTKRWLPIDFSMRNPHHTSIFISASSKRPLPTPRTTDDEEDSRRQEEVVLWLLHTGTQDVGAQDVYLNTPLHYLASDMWANEELLKKVREWEGGEAVWKNSRNELGYTPEDLWEDGKQAEREQWKTFWEDGDATSERILLSSNPFSMV
jgi:ankyrin repeat protein